MIGGSGRKEPRTSQQERAAVLGMQLEDLFVYVLRCESLARIDDRIDLAMRLNRPPKSPA
jgi:hypothetical protein